MNDDWKDCKDKGRTEEGVFGSRREEGNKNWVIGMGMEDELEKRNIDQKRMRNRRLGMDGKRNREREDRKSII